MGYGLGVDLGTTFAAAAVSRGEAVVMATLADNDLVMPSVVLVAEDGALLTGEAAEWRAVGDPLRVARGFKRRLGDPTPLVLGGTPYAPTALMAALLREVVARVTATEGEAPEHVVLTYPAVWGPYRREQFTEVPRLAGLRGVTLLTEPEAAAAHHVRERRLGVGQLVAVYDLGGGTFDTTVLRTRSDGMEILGTPEGIERLGGIDFDDALIAHVDSVLGGAVSGLDPRDPAQGAAQALLRRECVRAKEMLSTEAQVTISVRLPDGGREVTVTRAEFEDMIRSSIMLTVQALRRALSSAKVEPGELASIVLAGGSANIPLVGQVLAAEFGRPVHSGLQSKFTVALGAATTAARVARRTQRLGPPPRTAGAPAPAVRPRPIPTAPPQPVQQAPAWQQHQQPQPSTVDKPAGGRRRVLLAVAAVLVVAVVAGLVVLLTRKGADPVASDGRGGTPAPTSGPHTMALPSTPAPIVVGTIMNAGNGPTGSAITPDGRLLLVPNAVDKSVSFIDVTRNERIGAVQVTGQAMYVAVAPDGRTAYVSAFGETGAGRTASGQVAVVDIAARRVLREVAVGPQPRQPVVTPDGSRVYVPDPGSSSVWVFPADGPTATDALRINAYPYQVLISKDGGTGYVLSRDASAVYLVNLRNNAVLGHIPVAQGPLGMAMSPDQKALLTANADARTVSVANMSTLTAPTQVRVGAHPVAVAYAPDGQHAYVINSEDNDMSVIDTHTNTVTAVVRVGENPLSIAVTPDGRFAYVPNEHSDNITVVQTA